MRTMILTGMGTFLVFSFVIAFRLLPYSRTVRETRDVSDCRKEETAAERNSCYRTFCRPTEDCLTTILESVTREGGPEAGTSVLKDLLTSLAESMQSTGHELEHIVGRVTANFLGPSGNFFIRCPTDFAYGCQHGFLEEALAKGQITVSTATTLCDHLKNTSARQTFMCYHGIGHGLMMYRGHRLSVALRDCAISDEEAAVRGCAQGVYMENFIGYEKEDPGSYGFEEDPLAPCNRTNNKNEQWACYINHATYLLRRFDFDMQRAAAVCLDAPTDMIDTCIFEFGQLAADPEWQPMIMERKANSDATGDDFPETAVKLCGKTPTAHQSACHAGAVEHFLNYQRHSDAKMFCAIVENSLRDSCVSAIQTHEF